MKKQFVTYEIALKLKELDFDEPCMAVYLGKEGFYFRPELNGNKNSYFKDKSKSVSLPLWQQVIDWVREKYDIHFSFHYNPRTKKYAMWIEGPDEILRDHSAEIDILYSSKFDTYEECRKQSIIKAIEILEENDML
jgi:hypothetical protein